MFKILKKHRFTYDVGNEQILPDNKYPVIEKEEKRELPSGYIKDGDDISPLTKFTLSSYLTKLTIGAIGPTSISKAISDFKDTSLTSFSEDTSNLFESLKRSGNEFPIINPINTSLLTQTAEGINNLVPGKDPLPDLSDFDNVSFAKRSLYLKNENKAGLEKDLVEAKEKLKEEGFIIGKKSPTLTALGFLGSKFFDINKRYNGNNLLFDKSEIKNDENATNEVLTGSILQKIQKNLIGEENTKFTYKINNLSEKEEKNKYEFLFKDEFTDEDFKEKVLYDNIDNGFVTPEDNELVINETENQKKIRENIENETSLNPTGEEVNKAKKQEQKENEKPTKPLLRWSWFKNEKKEQSKYSNSQKENDFYFLNNDTIDEEYIKNEIKKFNDISNFEERANISISTENTNKSFSTVKNILKKEADLNKQTYNDDEISVPFYFQDLRNNKFIWFHAFIDNISDSSTPSYDSIDCIGRMEPIQIYRSTTRKISLSFVVFATNPTDFEIMWDKLNTFLMSVYPQFTLGRKQTILGIKKTVPFSQIAAAGPIVRMRVGDLIKSQTYTKDFNKNVFGETNYKEDGNKVINHFQEASKGLAGFIDSLEYSFDDSTWELEDNKQAPKKVKVTISFNPVNDIYPGLQGCKENMVMRNKIFKIGSLETKYEFDKLNKENQAFSDVLSAGGGDLNSILGIDPKNKIEKKTFDEDFAGLGNFNSKQTSESSDFDKKLDKAFEESKISNSSLKQDTFTEIPNLTPEDQSFSKEIEDLLIKKIIEGFSLENLKKALNKNIIKFSLNNNPIQSEGSTFIYYLRAGALKADFKYSKIYYLKPGIFENFEFSKILDSRLEKKIDNKNIKINNKIPFKIKKDLESTDLYKNVLKKGKEKQFASMVDEFYGKKETVVDQNAKDLKFIYERKGGFLFEGKEENFLIEIKNFEIEIKNSKDKNGKEKKEITLKSISIDISLFIEEKEEEENKTLFEKTKDFFQSIKNSVEEKRNNVFDEKLKREFFNDFKKDSLKEKIF